MNIENQPQSATGKAMAHSVPAHDAQQWVTTRRPMAITDFLSKRLSAQNCPQIALIALFSRIIRTRAAEKSYNL
jgi:hypothetical protein